MEHQAEPHAVVPTPCKAPLRVFIRYHHRGIVLGVISFLLLAGLNLAQEYPQHERGFWFTHGPSLTIPAQAKPGLFARMRNLIRATSLPSMLLGTVTLAVVANTYELLCAAGFPLLYTRLLTL